MKFSRTKELSAFLHENNIFTNIQSIREICLGGSSYNFYVKTAQGQFFLKLISAEREREVFLHLKKLLQQLDFLYPLAQENFENYRMLAMPYIFGHKLRYGDCTPELFAHLRESYLTMQAAISEPQVVKPQQNMPQMIAKISSFLSKDNSLSARLLDKYFWQKIRPELVCLEKSTHYIHGDFTSNNIMVDRDKYPHLFDFEQIRYGYEIEDVCYLFLQLSGFRGLWGRLSRFEKLQQMSAPLFDEPIRQEYWLYGVQLFYLNNLYRRLNNTKKRKSFRKSMCLLWSLRQYFRLSRYLHTV